MSKSDDTQNRAPRVSVKGGEIAVEGEGCTLVVDPVQARTMISELSGAVARLEDHALWDVEDHVPDKVGPWTSNRRHG